MKREKYVRPITYISLTLLAIFTLFPIVWMVFIAIRPREEMFEFSVPTQFSVANFERAIAAMGSSFINSIVLSLVTSLINVAICFLAAYAFARMQFRGKEVINNSLSIVYSVPGIFSVIPIFILFRSLGLLQAHPYISLILLYQTNTTPVNIWMATDFIMSIPKELEEAAYMDGCSTLGTLRKIIIPLCLPVLFTMMLMCFIEVWNEYLLASLFIKTRADYTYTVAIENLSTTAQYTHHGVTDWGFIAASSMLGFLPIAIVMVFTYKHFLRGITKGAVKL